MHHSITALHSLLRISEEGVRKGTAEDARVLEQLAADGACEVLIEVSGSV